MTTARAIWIGAAAACVPALAHAQQLGGGRSIELPFIRLALGLALCVVVALAAALLMKRFLRAGAPSLAKLSWLRGAGADVKVLETHRLSVHADVCRFAHAGKEYLVIVSSGGATVVRTDEVAPEVAQ